jgi:hypothetical protein
MRTEKLAERIIVLVCYWNKEIYRLTRKSHSFSLYSLEPRPTGPPIKRIWRKLAKL